jgi:hypothetical protein
MGYINEVHFYGCRAAGETIGSVCDKVNFPRNAVPEEQHRIALNQGDVLEVNFRNLTVSLLGKPSGQ